MSDINILEQCELYDASTDVQDQLGNLKTKVRKIRSNSYPPDLIPASMFGDWMDEYSNYTGTETSCKVVRKRASKCAKLLQELSEGVDDTVNLMNDSDTRTPEEFQSLAESLSTLVRELVELFPKSPYMMQKIRDSQKSSASHGRHSESRDSTHGPPRPTSAPANPDISQETGHPGPPPGLWGRYTRESNFSGDTISHLGDTFVMNLEQSWKPSEPLHLPARRESSYTEKLNVKDNARYRDGNHYVINASGAATHAIRRQSSGQQETEYRPRNQTNLGSPPVINKYIVEEPEDMDGQGMVQDWPREQDGARKTSRSNQDRHRGRDSARKTSHSSRHEPVYAQRK